MRDVQQLVTSYPRLHCILFSEGYVYFEHYASVGREGLINMVLSVAAVAMVMMFFLRADVFAVAFVTILIVIIDVCLMGMLPFVSVAYNSIAVVNSVMGIGLSVDYVSHIMLAYVAAGRTITAVEVALTEMGAAVFGGAASTFLGIILLSLSSSPVFRVFFTMMSLLVVFATFYGLFFLPVVLVLKCKLLEKVSSTAEVDGKRRDFRTSTDDTFGEDETDELIINEVASSVEDTGCVPEVKHDKDSLQEKHIGCIYDNLSDHEERGSEDTRIAHRRPENSVLRHGEATTFFGRNHALPVQSLDIQASKQEENEREDLATLWNFQILFQNLKLFAEMHDDGT